MGTLFPKVVSVVEAGIRQHGPFEATLLCDQILSGANGPHAGTIGGEGWYQPPAPWGGGSTEYGPWVLPGAAVQYRGGFGDRTLTVIKIPH